MYNRGGLIRPFFKNHMASEIKNIKEANEKIDSLEATVADQSETIAEQNNVIEELRSQLSKAKKEVKASKVIVKHEGKNYEVVIGKFSFQGEVHEADTLKSKPDVVAALIEAESSVLAEVK